MDDNNENKSFKKTKRRKIIKNILLVLSAIIITATIYIKRNYNLTGFEQILLTLQTGTTGTGVAVIEDIIIKNIFVLPLILILVFLPEIIYKQINKRKHSKKLENSEDKGRNLEIIKINKLEKIYLIISIIIFIISSAFLFSAFKFNKAFFNLLFKQTTKIYDKKYVDPRQIDIKMPEKKKNLIYIIVESLETTTFTKENGGQFKKSVTPELEKIALENINFSHTDKLGGFKMAPGATLTTGAMATLNTGISPIVNFDKFLGSPYQKSYMPGAYSIGQLLEKNGYNNQIIFGSDADFGKRRLFFETHGVKNILDYKEAKKLGYIPKDYFDNWWGFEDEKLFKIAKSEIDKSAKAKKPFFTTLLTVNTHFPEGRLPKGYKREYDKKYLDVYRHCSLMIDDFLDWLKTKDYYKDTVVVITGDHLTMNVGFFEDGSRYVYNAIINSDKKYNKERTKNRKFVTSDITPTILSAMNIKIQDDRYGMGTDLFSDKKTYTEEMGFEKYTEELQKLSGYYTKNILEEFNAENADLDERINNNFDYQYINEKHDAMEKRK